MMPNPKRRPTAASRSRCASPAPRLCTFSATATACRPTMPIASSACASTRTPSSSSPMAGKSQMVCQELRASPDLLRLPALHRPDRPQARRVAKRRPVRRDARALLRLQKHLLKHLGGDRIMADVLAAIPAMGWRLCGSRGTSPRVRSRPSGEHVQNVLARLKTGGDTIRIETPIPLKEEPKACPSLRSPAHGGEPCPLNWWRSSKR